MSKKAHFYLGFLSCALIVVAILIGVHESKASDWAVATVGSRHLDGGDWCEVNPGGGLELSTNDPEVRTLVGAYRNSYCNRWSVYLGRS